MVSTSTLAKQRRSAKRLKMRGTHIALNVAVETYLKGKLDAENGDACVEVAVRFDRWREVRCGRVVYVYDQCVCFANCDSRDVKPTRKAQLKLGKFGGLR